MDGSSVGLAQPSRGSPVQPGLEPGPTSHSFRSVRSSGDLPRPDAERAARLFASHLADGLYARVSLSADHYRRARALLARFDLPLQAPDALHLAVAAAESLRLITADRQLAANAQTLGLDVELLRPA